MLTLSSARKLALDALPSKAARIRALRAEGFRQAEIARFLGLSDQHVSNVLRRSEREGIASERLPAEAARATRDVEADAGGGAGRVMLRVEADGSLRLPSPLREAMDLDPSGTVSAEVVDGELRLISPRAAVRRIQRTARRYAPEGVSVVDAFLAGRVAIWGPG
ncbi:MAG: helix-turn-helix domain-containing protein [Rhodobacteraceae bacterium]|nr:helix-turn-helix domain-containing protein [Paracoccaceae bacterium]